MSAYEDVRVVIILLFAGLGSSCASGFGFMAFGHDTRSVVVQTLNVFDQSSKEENRKLPAISYDWIFRRERLAMIDETLRSNKADILFLQRANQRNASPVDSDDVILTAGVLSGYDSIRLDYSEIAEHEDHDYLFSAVGPPLRLSAGKALSQDDQIKTTGLEGVFILTSVVDVENLPVVMINVDVAPGMVTKLVDVYAAIGRNIDAVMDMGKVCRRRIVIGGTLPGTKEDDAFKDFLSKYDLVEALPDACADVGTCATLSPENALYAQVAGPLAKVRIDKILVHKDNDVLTSGLSFNKVFPAPDYLKSLGLENLTVSTHFGWAAEVKFSRCSVP